MKAANKDVRVVDTNGQKFEQINEIDFLFPLVTCLVELGECWNNYMARYNTVNGFPSLKKTTLLFIHNKYVAPKQT